MAELRICSDCKNFKDDGRCVRGERQVGVDPVCWRPLYKFKYYGYAFRARGSWLPWHCGKKGRYFEQKELK